MQELGNVLIWATLFQEETDKWTSVESVSVGFLCLFLIFFFDKSVESIKMGFYSCC